MFWNVASARDEISLRKWSGGTAQLRTLEGVLIAKHTFCWLCLKLLLFMHLYII